MTKGNGEAKRRPADVVDKTIAVGTFRAALWTDHKLVLAGLAGRVNNNGEIELTPEETMQLAKLTTSLIFI